MSVTFSSQFAEHGLVLWVGTASLWQGRGDGPLESGHSLLARKEKVTDIWLDEGNDLIRSCGALSKVLGLQRTA